VTTAVVVTYNSARWIDRCLTSLDGVPAIVIDNASQDDTPAVVRDRHPEVRLIARTRNGGFAVAVNEGSRAAPADDILLLNPDAVARPGSVAVLDAYLRDHPKVGVVAPRLLNPDGTRQDNVRTFPTPLTMLARRSPLGRTALGKRILRDHFLEDATSEVARPIPATIGAAMLVRRATIDAMGPMDERIFLYGEDWDWCYRAWAAGWEVHLEPASVMEHEYERQSRRTLDLRSAAVRHHWASALKLVVIHPGLVVGRMPAGARAAAHWRPPSMAT
jgi:N-acetylglucosaminyl-diphospho-decaprenol L-rhamnosyltransferase